MASFLVEAYTPATISSPRRVTSITVTSGARARGIGIGARIPAIRARFPNVTVDHSTDEIFRLTLVKTPRRASGGQITFGVSTQTKRTTVIGVPLHPVLRVAHGGPAPLPDSGLAHRHLRTTA